jgi:hypothetical protein
MDPTAVVKTLDALLGMDDEEALMRFGLLDVDPIQVLSRAADQSEDQRDHAHWEEWMHVAFLVEGAFCGGDQEESPAEWLARARMTAGSKAALAELRAGGVIL